MGSYSEDAKAGAAQAPTKGEADNFSFKIGDFVTIDGVDFKITALYLPYHNTNGDQNARYAVIYSSTHGEFVKTHAAIKREAQPKVTERFVTPFGILKADPCQEGMWALGVALGLMTRSARSMLPPKQELFIELVVGLTTIGCGNTSIRVSFLHDTFVERTGAPVPHGWLLWMAQFLKLVPEGSKLNIAALKRLLGIVDKG